MRGFLNTATCLWFCKYCTESILFATYVGGKGVESEGFEKPTIKANKAARSEDVKSAKIKESPDDFEVSSDRYFLGLFTNSISSNDFIF